MELNVLEFVVLVVLLAILYVTCKYYYNRYRLKDLVGPTPLPIIGNLHQIGTDNAGFFKILTKWAEDYRDAGYFVIYLGWTPNVILNNARDIEALLAENRNEKSFHYDFMSSWLHEGLALSKGEKWQSRRKLLTPSFHFSILSKFNDIMNEHARLYTEKLSALAGGPEFDIIPLTSLCTLDVAFETVLGTNPRTQLGHQKELVRALIDIGTVFTERVKQPWYWNETVFNLTGLGKRWARNLSIAHTVSREIIKERKHHLDLVRDDEVILDDKTQEVRKRRRLALLDLLIEAQRQHHDLTDDGIQEEVDTFLFTSMDTTSVAICAALYLLGRHPDIQEKAHEELDRVLGNDCDKPVAMEDLPKLDYMSRVVKESLRLLSAGPYIIRTLGVDLALERGGTLPKGTDVFLGLYWLHRDPEQFPDPLKFDPDRFLPENIDKRHHFAYLPFSAGQRNCIGQKFAAMELKIVLATVLRKLEVSSTQSMDELELVNELVLRPNNGYLLKMHPR